MVLHANIGVVTRLLSLLLSLLLSRLLSQVQRKIIREEWRSRRGVGQRVQQHFWNAIFDGDGGDGGDGSGGGSDGGGKNEKPWSRYAHRMPIGTMEVVDNCTPLQLRQFYNKWYRPNRLAVVVVGDCDPITVERMVHDAMCSLPSGTPTPGT